MASSQSNLVELTNVYARNSERLFFRDGVFMVQHLGKSSPLPSDALSRDMLSLGLLDAAMVIALQSNGYFELQKSSSADIYRLDYSPHMEGGGVICGKIAYWFTKGILHAIGAAFISKAFRRNNAPVQNTLVDAAVGMQLSPEAALGATYIANSENLTYAMEQAAPILAMTVASSPSVAGLQWVETAARTMERIFTNIRGLP
jgi:hypothetical protein